jgi:hypothetical protein
LSQPAGRIEPTETPLVARLVLRRELTVYRWITSESARRREDEGSEVVARVAALQGKARVRVGPAMETGGARRHGPSTVLGDSPYRLEGRQSALRPKASTA